MRKGSSAICSLPYLISRISRSLFEHGLGTTPSGKTQYGGSGVWDTAPAAKSSWISCDTNSVWRKADGWLRRLALSGGAGFHRKRKPKRICFSRNASAGVAIDAQKSYPLEIRSALADLPVSGVWPSRSNRPEKRSGRNLS